MAVVKKQRKEGREAKNPNAKCLSGRAVLINSRVETVAADKSDVPGRGPVANKNAGTKKERTACSHQSSQTELVSTDTSSCDGNGSRGGHLVLLADTWG